MTVDHLFPPEMSESEWRAKTDSILAQGCRDMFYFKSGATKNGVCERNYTQL